MTDPAADNITARYYSQSAWAYSDGTRGDDVVAYLFTDSVSASESEPRLEIVCRAASIAAGCSINQFVDRFGRGFQPLREYRLMLGDLSGTRFKARSKDGATVEGFRLGVD